MENSSHTIYDRSGKPAYYIVKNRGPLRTLFGFIWGVFSIIFWLGVINCIFIYCMAN